MSFFDVLDDEYGDGLDCFRGCALTLLVMIAAAAVLLAVL